MTHMTDVFGPNWAEQFKAARDIGDITLREHPEFPTLLIANYTPQTAYKGTWNDITLASRGLIFDIQTGEILARPFAKFFNFGQTGAPEIDFDARLYGVGDKFDGSLGIGYVRPDGQFAIATRGSFDSEQARHANALIGKKNELIQWQMYKGDITGPGYTPLFEIIYPENRIVLDYEQQDYLQPLGWVRIETGEYIGVADPDVFNHGSTFREVLSRAPRHNSEGWVVWIDPLTAVKFKQEDYVALHAIVTGLNEKTVWRAVQEGPEKFAEFVAKLPDELQPWANGVAAKLNIEFSIYMSEIDQWFQAVNEAEYQSRVAWDADFDRARFARRVQAIVPGHMQGFVFAVLDGKDYQGKIWKLLEPKGNISYRNVTEEEA